MTIGRGDREIVGRAELLETIDQLLRQRRSVLLVGAEGVGKSALIEGLNPGNLMVIDPFENITAHHAARIRRAMDRGAVCLAAARTRDRTELGCVGRIAWRFTTVRVRPLSDVWIRRLLGRECGAVGISQDELTLEWMRAAAELAQGRPGVVVAIAEEAARMRARAGRLPPPAAAYLEASIRRITGLTHAVVDRR